MQNFFIRVHHHGDCGHLWLDLLPGVLTLVSYSSPTLTLACKLWVTEYQIGQRYLPRINGIEEFNKEN